MSTPLQRVQQGPESIGTAAALGRLESAATDTRPAVLSALTEAVGTRTADFLLVSCGQPVDVVSIGAAVTDLDVARVRAAIESGADVTALGWQSLVISDDLRLVLRQHAEAGDDLAAIVVAARLALRNQVLAQSAAFASAEVEAMRSVATRILRARELDEALLAVTNETLGLLESDIAGVLLRDGDEIVMRACAGNQLADTGQLRMRRGQGLAGHIFATGQAAMVDDYLLNDVISNDFNYLARAERTRSALGAPLVVDGVVIGVLEVWRRRESSFLPADVRRLVALADLAAIALDNARQHEISRSSQRAVVIAHHELQLQLGKVEHALVGQQALIEAVVDGEQLPGIAGIVSERNDCDVLLLDADLEILATAGPVPDLEPIRAVIRERRAGRDPAGRDAAGGGTQWASLPDRNLAVRVVRTGTDEIGWVCLLTAASIGDDAIELAASQAAMTFAVHHLEQQAALKARAIMREDLLLNLLKGSADERRAAIARAKYLRIDLKGTLRIAVCTFSGLQSHAAAAHWSSPSLDQMQRKMFHHCEESLNRAGLLRLAAPTGDGMIALIHPGENDNLRSELDAVSGSLQSTIPQCRPIWGVSGLHTSADQLDRAYREASTASQALREDSERNVALYEDLGVLALLIAGPQGIALNQFARDTIGPILTHDARHGTSLVETLRAYLDANCNQKETAKRLFVHEKTVKYRLETIQKLTELNLHEHNDRMHADIAVRAIDLQ